MASFERESKWKQIFLYFKWILISFVIFMRKFCTVPEKSGARSERNYNSSFIGLCEVHWPSMCANIHTRYSSNCSVLVPFVVRRQIGQMVDVWWVWRNHWCEKSCASFYLPPRWCVGKCEATKCNILKDAETQYKLLTREREKTVSTFLSKRIFDRSKLLLSENWMATEGKR